MIHDLIYALLVISTGAVLMLTGNVLVEKARASRITSLAGAAFILMIFALAGAQIIALIGVA